LGHTETDRLILKILLAGVLSPFILPLIYRQLGYSVSWNWGWQYFAGIISIAILVRLASFIPKIWSPDDK